MGFQDNHFGRIANVDPANLEVSVDIGALVRRLILFETCILDSQRFREMPRLVETFGADGVLHLLETGALRIVNDQMIPANANLERDEKKFREQISRGSPFGIVNLRLASAIEEGPERKKWVSDGLQVVRYIGIPFKKEQALRLELA